jgi:hypothetical protein
MTMLATAQLMGSLGGMFVKDNPQADYMKNMQALYSKYLSPDAMRQGTQGYYNNYLSSPAYQQGLSSLINQSQNTPTGPLGAGGIGDTRSLLRGMSFAPALMGMQSNAWNNAGTQYQNSIQSMMGGAQQIGRPNFGFPQQYGAMLNTLGQMGMAYGMRGQQQERYNPNYAGTTGNGPNYQWLMSQGAGNTSYFPPYRDPYRR